MLFCLRTILSFTDVKKLFGRVVRHDVGALDVTDHGERAHARAAHAPPDAYAASDAHAASDAYTTSHAHASSHTSNTRAAHAPACCQ